MGTNLEPPIAMRHITAIPVLDRGVPRVGFALSPGRLGRGRRSLVAIGLLALPALLALLAIPVTPTSAHAGNPAAFTSHLLAPDPEWQAMRGARSATGPGLAASLGNPAAIGSLSGGAAACTHLQWAGGLAREWAGAGRPIGHGIVMAFDAAILRTPELPGYDVDGNSTTPFRASEWSAAVHAALPIGHGIGVGAGTRVFRLEDGTEPLTGTGFSFGIQARDAGRTLGLALTDAGAPMKGPHGAYALPTCWRAGLEQEMAGEKVLLAASIERAISGTTHGALGVIMRPAASLELLGGLLMRGSDEGEPPLGWSAGATVYRGSLAVSYAFRQEEALGVTHIVGLRMDLRGARSASHTIRIDTPSALPRAAMTERTTTALDRPEPTTPIVVTANASALERSLVPDLLTAPAAKPLTTVAPRYGVFGGRYRSAAAAGPEVALIRREGFPGARPVSSTEGSWRVQVLDSPTAREADAAVTRLRARAIVVTAESLDVSLSQAVSPALP